MARDSLMDSMMVLGGALIGSLVTAAVLATASSGPSLELPPPVAEPPECEALTDAHEALLQEHLETVDELLDTSNQLTRCLDDERRRLGP